ncbi:hypothetical protein AYI68_g8059 [Smittium mucronatum]|uniref:Uncharacterized protein n=1 Tax=Smittium mucronatum TaxID=133383 RepID=A0A1R0GLX7_9FUNG|nr:hypothetical protein AYI68_g8059 [Smittium mucronatum]
MRRYSPEKTRVVREHVKEFYQEGYARPSSSPYSAKPVIVPKNEWKCATGYFESLLSDSSTSELYLSLSVLYSGWSSRVLGNSTGHSNSPTTFQRNIDRTLCECIDTGYCSAFDEDILF